MPEEGDIIFDGKPNCCVNCAAWCRNTHWLITTTYIQREVGVCCVTTDSLQMMRVKDIQYNSCCCCHCGTITIWSSDETTPQLKIAGIPNGKAVYEKLRDAINNLMKNAKLELDA